MNKSQLLMAIGALGLIIAAFLPWISSEVLFGMDRGIDIGWEGDGYVTGGIGLILFLGILTLRKRADKRFPILGILFGLLICAAIIADFLRIVEIAPQGNILASTDIGLYLTFTCGLLVVISGLYALQSLKN
ncbi:hypothetical protein KQH61_03380 [bacterium]|nr:hypothetical protein [bacterium]MCB2178942.1 hypothetical protein [bacterium]